jgi:restriction system protein
MRGSRLGSQSVLFLLVSAAVLFTVLLRWLRPRLHGALGEAAVSRRLRRYCAKVADDLIVPDDHGGLTQIDHLALTPAGLLVVETKNYSGLIFGETRDSTWTQCIGRQRNKFQNPLRQNFGHTKAVEAIAPGVPVAGIVVFTDRARFPNGRPAGVLTLSELRSRYAPEKYIGVPHDYRGGWDAVVARARTDRDARRAHLAALRQRSR